MGVKRPFDEEDFQVSSVKQAKQLEFDNKQTSFSKAFSSDDVSQNSGSRAGDFDKCQLFKELGNEDSRSASSSAEKELETSAPLSWVTSSSGEEDAGSGEPFYVSLFPEYFEFNFPRRTVVHLEDSYSSLMNSSPRKQIPIGPNHQAEIPPWDPQAVETDPLTPNNCVRDDNEEAVGTCIISASLSSYASRDEVKIGQGRKDCVCLDRGSVRCVRQHIKEAREKLREVIGDEKFLELGFYDMGEEVAAKWTEEEERVFHEVVYYNPVSLGKNFWKQLAVAFPSRTSRDLVSFYFNVFMLRRRAVQNRSNLLEIDSDDDESQGNDGGFFRVVGEDEDSVVESLGDQDVQEGSEDDIPSDDEDDAGDGDDDDDDDSDDGNGDGEVGRDGGVGAERGVAIGMGDLRGQILKPQIDILHNDFRSDHLPGMFHLRDARENHNFQEDCSTSSESQVYMGASCDSFGLRCDTRESRLKEDFTGCLAGESNGSTDDLDSGFLLESGDTKVWDDSCSTVLAKGFDLLPTCNIIEEIFGPCTSKSN
ncbi:uncharacterized protein [Coffea arabica]|uniref:Uncharacterized protein isoform X2 n=1 Tax=Coffea arabica TaxID=13443 RepID=A0A6P6V5I0_COFAR|nr:uncharacterized protein LOC113717363 [Coffea arabica]